MTHSTLMQYCRAMEAMYIWIFKVTTLALLLVHISCTTDNGSAVVMDKQDTASYYYVRMHDHVNDLVIRYKHEMEDKAGTNDFFRENLLLLHISSAYGLISQIKINWSCHLINRQINPPDYYTEIENVPVLIYLEGSSLMHHNKQAIMQELIRKYPQYKQEETAPPATCNPEIWRFFICNETKEVFSLMTGDLDFMDITKAMEKCL